MISLRLRLLAAVLTLLPLSAGAQEVLEQGSFTPAAPIN